MKFFFDIMDNIIVGVIVIDISGNINYANPAYLNMTGLNLANIVGRKMQAVRPGARLPEVLINGKPIKGVIRRVNGKEFVVDCSPIIIDGKVQGAIAIVNQSDEVQRLAQELRSSKSIVHSLERALNHAYRATYNFDDIICNDDNMVKLIKLAQKFANTSLNILIRGESGTGKELFAHSIHNASPSKLFPFIAINCAAIPSHLLESELFGYQEGAFTGAKRIGKPGLFELADKGTIFLDEIGDMGLELQGKLLRFLEDGVLRRIGGTQELKVSIRVIAATNKDIEKMVTSGEFRSDLYYRINGVTLWIPPLRERRKDILLIAEEFVYGLSAKMNKQLRLSYEVQKKFGSHSWPGNIRELKNVIEYAVTSADEKEIMLSHLPKYILKNTTSTQVNDASPVAKSSENEQEKLLLLKLLAEYGNSVEDKKAIAKRLGVSLATVYNKMKKYEIKKKC